MEWQEYARREFKQRRAEIEGIVAVTSKPDVPMEDFRRLALAADDLVKALRCGEYSQEDEVKALEHLEDVLTDSPAFPVTHVEYCKRKALEEDSKKVA